MDKYVDDGNVIATGGFVGANHPEALIKALQERYLETQSPKDLTLVYAAGQGDGDVLGLNHLGEEGLIGKVIGGHWNMAPRMQKLAMDNKIAAYNLPQGVISKLFRATAEGSPGLITTVGLNTFVDPRLEGGKLNDKAREGEDAVELINLKGKDMLYYPARKIDVALIRATYCDTEGNATLEKEACFSDVLVIAQAAKNTGGKVILQVEKVVEYGSLDSRKVKLPGIYVDAVVVAKPEEHKQTWGSQYNPAYSGETRVPVDSLDFLKLNPRKIIARRAAMELVPNAISNLGIGMPEGVSLVCAEEGVEGLILTTEAGTIGGVPAGGTDFGATTNPDCILDQPAQFDFYDGGGLDITILGLAQMDKKGNINVSKFGPKIAGCGGFINISQNTNKVLYIGTFTAGGFKAHVEDGKLIIDQEGKVAKLVDEVEQVTFSGDYANSTGQDITYITERAVFKLTKDGVELTEIAPGIDLEKDILAHMEFKPIIKDVKEMDRSIFVDELMGLKDKIRG